MPRFSLPRILIIFGSLVFFVTFWYIVQRADDGATIRSTCNVSEEQLTKLAVLLEKVHHILDRLSMVHFLCYGSLWGQIRVNQLHPWSKKAELCMLNEDLVNIDEARFYSAFVKENLKIKYLSSDGVYVIEHAGELFPFVEIYIFQRDMEQRMYKRVGWRRRILPPHCDWTPSLDCFPVHLIELPLPTKEMNGIVYPVPMGGIEMQKYHYPHDWWKPMKPNCNPVQT